MWCPLPLLAFFSIFFSNFLVLANRIDLLYETLAPGFSFAFLPGLPMVVTLHERHSNVLFQIILKHFIRPFFTLYGSKEVPGEIIQTEIPKFYLSYFYEKQTHVK